jgi:hypothetical protein
MKDGREVLVETTPTLDGEAMSFNPKNYVKAFIDGGWQVVRKNKFSSKERIDECKAIDRNLNKVYQDVWYAAKVSKKLTPWKPRP